MLTLAVIRSRSSIQYSGFPMYSKSTCINANASIRLLSACFLVCLLCILHERLRSPADNISAVQYRLLTHDRLCLRCSAAVQSVNFRITGMSTFCYKTLCACFRFSVLATTYLAIQWTNDSSQGTHLLDFLPERPHSFHQNLPLPVNAGDPDTTQLMSTSLATFGQGIAATSSLSYAGCTMMLSNASLRIASLSAFCYRGALRTADSMMPADKREINLIQMNPTKARLNNFAAFAG